jgi:hypothetical protein
MPIEETAFGQLAYINTNFVIKIFLILFLIFYTFFAFMLLRQIQTLAKELPTSIAPLLRFLAIINLGVSLAILFIVIGVF